MAQWIRASYDDIDDASRAVDRLTAMGYGRDEMSVVMSPQTRERYDARREPAVGDDGHISRAATSGGVIGAALGALLATTTVTGAAAATVLTGGLAAPFVAGPLAAALAGLAGGGAIGALVGAAGWEEDRDKVQAEIESGDVIIAVKAHTGDEVAVREALNDANVADRPLIQSERARAIRGTDVVVQDDDREPIIERRF
jgi:hypothetical protein